MFHSTMYYYCCNFRTGISQAVYPLDESLIDFGTAIDDQDYLRAIDILDTLEVTPEVEAMWKQLCGVAVASGNLSKLSIFSLHNSITVTDTIYES